MTCPRCGGSGTDTRDDCVECGKEGKCIVRFTRCTACGFGIYNVVWAEGDGLQYRGWMTTDGIPDDMPYEVKVMVRG